MSATSETPRTSPRQKLDRILEAAATLFSEQGFAGTPVEAISRRAGVSKGLIYVHFPSKEALLEAVLEIAVTRWFEVSIQAAMSGDLGVGDMIATSLRASIDHARRDPVLRGLLAQDPLLLLGRRPGEPDRAALAHTSALRGLIRRGVRNGELRKDLDPARAADALGLMHAALVRELFTRPRLKSRGDGQDLVDASIDLLLSGIRARGDAREGAR